ncbi:RNA polymerase sigma factor [Corallococcus exercitus]|uniref:RNA polymerase sigma factor n=1 Tax=Corallococcus exercitus TaxID=2316736 RepID=UPI0035D4F664
MTPRGFISLVLPHLPTLLRTGLRLTRNPAHAEDLVQDTVVRALERRGELRSPEQLRGWLLAVQRTVHLNGARGLRPRLEVLQGGSGSEAPLPEPTGDLERELHARALGPSLTAGLAAIAPEWREALWLREVEELSYEEIAQVQDCPVGTVRSRLARARGALLDFMQRESGRERM